MSHRFEAKVTEILNAFGIDSAPIPVEKIASKLDLTVTPTDLGPGVSGALVIKDGKATIGVNHLDSIVRRRFTIAHELGHFILHNKNVDKLFVDTQILFRSEDASVGDKIKEREANAFAAALLMPKSILIEEIDEAQQLAGIHNDDDLVYHLAKRFKVSEIAMTYRLSALGYIF